MAAQIPLLGSAELAAQVRMLESIVGAVSICDRDWRFRYLSPGVEAMLGAHADELLGRCAWDMSPDLVGTPLHATCVRAVERREPVDLVWYSEARDVWYEQRIVCVDEFVVVATRDVSVREFGLRRREQLLHFTEALAGVDTPEAAGEALVTRLTADLPLQGAAVLIDDARHWYVLAADGLDDDVLEPLTQGLPPRPGGAPPGVAGGGRLSVFPLQAGGSLLGSLVLVLSPGVAALSDERLGYVRTAVASTALALSRTLRSAAEHRAAITLQRSLLPEVGARLGCTDLAVRYLPGDPGVQVGGDWFDAVAVPEGLVLVVGDVEGHDVEAAAIMGQLRSVVRAYAAEGLPPTGILRRVDRYLEGLQCERIATVLLVYLHCDGEVATVASAGHLRPLVLEPSGGGWACGELAVDVGPPLGVPGGRWREETLLLPPGASLLLFTDGLVETAAWGGSERGMRRLLEGLRAAPADATLDDLLDTALTVIPPGLRGDDVAVLAARIRAAHPGPRRAARRAFPSRLMTVPLARSWLRGLLTGWSVPHDLVDDGELVMAELASNAIRHTEEPVAVHVRLDDGELLLEIYDRSHRLPVLREAGLEDPSGRGLAITAALAREWGVREELHGKVVWARIPVG